MYDCISLMIEMISWDLIRLYNFQDRFRMSSYQCILTSYLEIKLENFIQIFYHLVTIDWYISSSIWVDWSHFQSKLVCIVWPESMGSCYTQISSDQAWMLDLGDKTAYFWVTFAQYASFPIFWCLLKFGDPCSSCSSRI